MKYPIRILHVLGRLDRGGAETMLINLYRNINRSEVQFDFIIHTNEKCDYSEEIESLGGRIFSIPRYTGKNHFTYKKAWEKFFNNYPEYKVIHGHMRSTASIYLRIAKKYGLATIAHSHSTASRGNLLEQVVKNSMQFPIRFTADYLFACSEDAGKWLFGKRAIKKKNYKIIKNAIDCDKYKFNETIRNRIRRLLNISEKFVIGHVGNYTPPKNHMFLLDVFFEVQKRDNNAILLLIGEGALRKEIEAKSFNLGIADKVIIKGSVSNVSDYLQAMDVFAFPSIFEGLGIAVIEAQASGLPCIISEQIPNEVEVSSLVERLALTSSTCWANTILNLVKLEKRSGGVSTVLRQNYDIKSQVNILKDTYLNIIKKHRGYELSK